MTTPDLRPSPQAGRPTVEEQAGEVLMPLAAGYVGHRTVAMGLRTGLVETLADAPDGATAGELGDSLGFDPFYVEVWCRAGVAAGLLDGDGIRFRLAPHMDTLLLDATSPAHAGPLFEILEQPEIFELFEQRLPTGERTWWDEAGPDFIDNVSGTGRPFYTRLVPGGLEQVPGLQERLSSEDCRVLDTACGAGLGVVRLAEHYPGASIAGADGDEHSLDLARARAEEAGVGDRVELIHTPLEALDPTGEFDLVINNISMHECRDIDQVTANVHGALKPGGWFVISDLPFPDDVEGLRTIPGRVMSGIQYWEAQIDDQLLPRQVYDDLLDRHGFAAIGSFEINPTHAVTYGRA